MATVSLCMIVKNEENTLERCLRSVRDLVEEIIVVDTGSTDRTGEIAAKYADRVCAFPWRDDFAAARNFAFDQGNMDYLMWLDADDVLEEADRKRFAERKRMLEPDTDVVMMAYHTAFDDQGEPTFTYYRERLVRRERGLRWVGAVHECIAPAGKVVWWDVAVSHRKTSPGDPDRNLRIYEGQLKRGEILSPREQFYYARELIYHSRDKEAAVWLEGFLNGGGGWIENVLQACQDLAGCYERMGREEDAFRALTRALRLGPPRAELCCELGRFFFRREDWAAASYWYQRALDSPESGTAGGFTQPDCRGYIPLLQLCVCCWHMGELERAAVYNERAGRLKPESRAVQYNRALFQKQGVAGA